jgi:hypothetical protein
MLVPIPIPRIVAIVITAFWCVLFLFGAIRFISEKQWGFALFCLVVGLLFMLGVARYINDVLRSRKEPPAPSEHGPIE